MRHSYAEFLPELKRIRAISRSIDSISWTSYEYQRDLLSNVIANADQGGCVIEAGAFKGGLTVQLAAVCARLGLELHSVDAWEPAIHMTRDHLKAQGLEGAATLHYATFANFIKDAPPAKRAVLVILDGDHRYEVVKDDIAAALRLTPAPYALAFHDYSLRHHDSGERVDDAVHETFCHAVVTRIGQQFSGEGHATEAHPQADGHFWKVPGSEGAIALVR